jgi:hypothetical protein
MKIIEELKNLKRFMYLYERIGFNYGTKMELVS